VSENSYDERFRELFLDPPFRELLRDEPFRELLFREELFREELFRGTFAPFFRASDKPIAIACLRLVTFLPEPPLRSVPRLRSRITWRTLRCAFLPYLAIRTP
jgi:hypothetical protein